MRELAAQTILDAAEQVFGEKGLDAPMEAIASRAGVAVGTLYNHFKDRPALITALLDARREDLLARVDAASDEARGRPFRARLLAVLEALVSGMESHLAFRRQLLQSDNLRSPSRKQQWARELISHLEDVFQQGHAEKALEPDPQRLQPIFFIGLLHTAMSTSLLVPDRLPQDQIAQTVCRQFLSGAGAGRKDERR